MTKQFRWMSFPGLVIILVGCAIIAGDDDDDDEPEPTTFYVEAATLNIRSAPSTKAVVVGHASRGTAFVPSDQSGDWYGVELTDGSIGWVHRDYVSTRDE